MKGKMWLLKLAQALQKRARSLELTRIPEWIWPEAIKLYMGFSNTGWLPALGLIPSALGGLKLKKKGKKKQSLPLVAAEKNFTFIGTIMWQIRIILVKIKSYIFVQH